MYEAGILEALSLVDACIRIAIVHKPQWWALENPIGTLVRWLGPPKMYFQPNEFGDPYTKNTCLWGEFNTDLPKNFVEPTEGSKMWKQRVAQTPKIKLSVPMEELEAMEHIYCLEDHSVHTREIQLRNGIGQVLRKWRV